MGADVSRHLTPVLIVITSSHLRWSAILWSPGASKYGGVHGNVKCLSKVLGGSAEGGACGEHIVNQQHASGGPLCWGAGLGASGTWAKSKAVAHVGPALGMMKCVLGQAFAHPQQ